jgi:tight adherence protein C
MAPSLLAALVMAVAGLGVMAAVVVRARRAAPDFAEFFDGLDYHSDDGFQERLAQPFLVRVPGAVGRAVASRLEGLLPAAYVETVRGRLAQAGYSGRRTAGQQLATQLALGAAGAAGAPFIPAGSSSTRPLAMLLLPVIGFMLPAVRLKRAIRTRADQIFKDLPDVVDMMAIAVEAGSGFEAAIQVVCTNFTSPLADELSIALHEMELGLSRREALQQLRDRVDLDVVRTLMLSLLQADALGIPIGRVLKSQATEVRNRRRAWAREKAAKLPVKIMFPLVLFIFPPIMALVLAPAALSFGKLG